jgi:hypothetical protein
VVAALSIRSHRARPFPRPLPAKYRRQAGRQRTETSSMSGGPAHAQRRRTSTRSWMRSRLPRSPWRSTFRPSPPPCQSRHSQRRGAIRFAEYVAVVKFSINSPAATSRDNRSARFSAKHRVPVSGRPAGPSAPPHATIDRRPTQRSWCPRLDPRTTNGTRRRLDDYVPTTTSPYPGATQPAR